MNLSTTIPPEQIAPGLGDPVFPVLRAMLEDYPRLAVLVDAREAYGMAKYGQTLMTGDERDTPTEVMNEALDLLAYLAKYVLQVGQDDLNLSMMYKAIDLADSLLAMFELDEEETK